MNLAHFLRRIACPECDWTEVWGPEEMAHRLRQQGQLRRAAELDPQFVIELFVPAAVNLPCPGCRHLGVHVKPFTDGMDCEDWGEGRQCEVCRKPIPAERVEVFPDVRRCVACQAKPPTVAATEADFCPRCGGLVVLQSSGGGSITRYLAVCSSCGLRT